MKLLFWNIRGFGKLGKRSKIRELLKERRVDLAFFQETKKSGLTRELVRSVWSDDNFEFLSVDADGSAGEVLCVWRLEVFVMSHCCSSRCFILLSGTIFPDFQCLFINIYAPNDDSRRGLLWNVIKNLRSDFPGPWCLGGDFNEIRSLGKRKGCTRRDSGMLEFNNFIEELELFDVPMLGRQFTWSNLEDGGRWSRIDRVLLSSEWIEKFKLKLWGLPRGVSDHCPLILMEDVRDWGPKPFRFINAWLLHPEFLSFIKKSWEELTVYGWAGFVTVMKLRHLRLVLKKWNREVFGNVSYSLKKAQEELHELDLVSESRDLGDDEVDRRRVVRKLEWSLFKREEWMWLQKSRLDWSLKGDKNTRFFHTIASSRQCRNFLSSITVDGECLEEPNLVKGEVLRHFKQVFSEDWGSRPQLRGQFRTIGQDQLVEGLEAVFSEDEVWAAIKNSDGNRASGPDGFNLACFQNC